MNLAVLYDVFRNTEKIHSTLEAKIDQFVKISEYTIQQAICTQRVS